MRSVLSGDHPEVFFKVSEESQQGIKFRSSAKFKVLHPGKFSLCFFLSFLCSQVNDAVANFSA